MEEDKEDKEAMEDTEDNNHEGEEEITIMRAVVTAVAGGSASPSYLRSPCPAYAELGH